LPDAARIAVLATLWAQLPDENTAYIKEQLFARPVLQLCSPEPLGSSEETGKLTELT
jgi:hypothetical protein